MTQNLVEAKPCAYLPSIEAKDAVPATVLLFEKELEEIEEQARQLSIYLPKEFVDITWHYNMDIDKECFWLGKCKSYFGYSGTSGLKAEEKHFNDYFERHFFSLLKSIEERKCTLQSCNEAIRNNKEIVLAAIKQDIYALGHASKALKDDKDFMLDVVKHNSSALSYASDRLKADFWFVLDLININVKVFEDASDKFRDDKEFMLAAVKQNGAALQYASARLKNDIDVVLAAMSQDSNSKKYASERVQDSIDCRPHLLSSGLMLSQIYTSGLEKGTCLENFNKIYTALYDGQSSFFKGRKRRPASLEEAEAYAIKRPESRTAKALILLKEEEDNLKRGITVKLFEKIYDYAFSHSSQFKKSKQNHTVDYVGRGHNTPKSFFTTLSILDARPFSRAGKIRTALYGRDPMSSLNLLKYNAKSIWAKFIGLDLFSAIDPTILLTDLPASNSLIKQVKNSKTLLILKTSSRFYQLGFIDKNRYYQEHIILDEEIIEALNQYSLPRNHNFRLLEKDNDESTLLFKNINVLLKENKSEYLITDNSRYAGLFLIVNMFVKAISFIFLPVIIGIKTLSDWVTRKSLSYDKIKVAIANIDAMNEDELKEFFDLIVSRKYQQSCVTSCNFSFSIS